MILSNNRSDDHRTDDGTENDENYVEQTEGDTECAEDARSDDYRRNEVNATDNCLHWKGQKTKLGKVKSSTQILRRWQNILTKLSYRTNKERQYALHSIEVSHYRLNFR
jgi:hypothetical protein